MRHPLYQNPRPRVPIGAVVALGLLALLIVAGLLAIFWPHS
jgi:hypothetical protein